MAEPISPRPAPGEDTSTALALVNTEVEPRGVPVDLLPDGRTLGHWLHARGLTSRRLGAVADEELAGMRRLRTAIRVAFMARAAGRRPPWGAMQTINEAAARVARTPRLRWTGSGPVEEIVWAAGAAATDAAFAEIAANAIRMLVGDRGDRLRLCEAHGCNRMFIAEHRRRRWCSRTCGDRVRVARHHAKRRRTA
jgi:predicted RNA-binding Zn ribbon-like protein